MSSRARPWPHAQYTGTDRRSRPRSPSRPFSPRESVAVERRFRPPTTRCSLGLLPSQGSIPPRRVQLSGQTAPVGFAGAAFPRPKPQARRAGCPPECSGAKAGRSLSTPAVPLEVSHLVTPLGGSEASAARAHGFTSDPESRRRNSGGSSLGRRAVPAEAETAEPKSLLPAKAHRVAACRSGFPHTVPTTG
jgi:hypothetical protein